MAELNTLPNIGSVVMEKLKQVGIETAEDLINVGSLDAFTRIRSVDPIERIESLK